MHRQCHRLDARIGWLLMKHMIEFSRQKDLKTARGQVLAENATMLAMCAELGFHIAVDPDDRMETCIGWPPTLRQRGGCLPQLHPWLSFS